MAGVWEEALVEEVVCFVEKLIRRLECHLQSGDMEKAQELSKRVKKLYEVRQSIRNFIKMLLFDISKKLNSAPYAPWSKTCPTKT